MSKNFCQIHHYYYEGIECPLCSQERFERYAKKYSNRSYQNIEKQENKTREITQEDLNKLVDKFKR